MSLEAKARRLVSIAMASVVRTYVEMSWLRQSRRGVAHGLPAPLSVSLTSYPPRFPTLALTLKSLLAQSVRPDHLYLWIADGDLASLPQAVRDLEPHGLTIQTCADTRSYKKITPLLMRRQDQFTVIVDDDVHYPRDWLRQLTQAYEGDSREVLCTRAHRIRLDMQGAPLPYLRWDSEIAAAPGSVLTFPTGIGGVLYGPGIFHADVTRSDLFLRFCPTTDDVWLYWMAALNGATFRKIGKRRRMIAWAGSQQMALAVSNAALGFGNDQQIQNLLRYYGPPDWRQQGPADETHGIGVHPARVDIDT